ncbi:MAG: nuclear transport factor 2 family protein [Parvibaculaceae bacterium]
MTPSQAVRAILRGWEEADPDAIASLFASDGIFDDPLQPRRRIGPADVREACAGGIAAVRNCHIPLRTLLESGDMAFAEGEFLSELASTGARFDFPFALVLEMKGGKVTRLSEYFDTSPLKAG